MFKTVYKNLKKLERLISDAERIRDSTSDESIAKKADKIASRGRFLYNYWKDWAEHNFGIFEGMRIQMGFKIKIRAKIINDD